MIDFLNHFWQLSLMLGVYVLLGLIFVGIIHLYVSVQWIEKHLGVKSKYSTLKGALYGIPLPLCSCGVIPLATSLRKKGASKKAVTSFFITTPMTGIDSIIATYGVFGLPMALLRVTSSFISGIIAGTFVSEDKNDLTEENKNCCLKECCGTAKNKTKLQTAFDYAIFEVFSDVAKPMFYGLILATLFIMFIPENGTQFLNENIFLAYLLVFILSLPLYVCSISAIPIALSMLSTGVTPGIAFIFLAAAPATNIITAGVIKKILGNNTLIIYLISIISTTLVFALLIDFVFPLEWFNTTISKSHQEDHSLISIVGAIIFLILLTYFITPLQKYRRRTSHDKK